MGFRLLPDQISVMIDSAAFDVDQSPVWYPVYSDF